MPSRREGSWVTTPTNTWVVPKGLGAGADCAHVSGTEGYAETMVPGPNLMKLAHDKELRKGMKAPPLGPKLQGLVHLLESVEGVPVEAPSEHGDQKAPEGLPLDEAHPVSPEGLDGEDMLSIEEPRDPKVPEPA